MPPKQPFGERKKDVYYIILPQNPLKSKSWVHLKIMGGVCWKKEMKRNWKSISIYIYIHDFSGSIREMSREEKSQLLKLVWSWLRVEVTRQRIIGEAFNHQRPFALRSWKLTQNRERFLFWDTRVLPIYFWHRKEGFDHWRCFFCDLGLGLCFCWDFHWDFWVLSSSSVQSFGVYDRYW